MATHKQQPLFPDSGMPHAGRSVKTERLPTNTTTAGHPIHRWFNFIAGFSPEFVGLVCREALTSQEPAVLLDPFAGCGTAPVEAAAQGLEAVGYEAHPFFERICRAKLSGRQAAGHLGEIEEAIITGLGQPVSARVLGDAPRAFLEKLFPPGIPAQLIGARESLAGRGLLDDPLAFLVLSRTLERCSHSATDGIYKAPTTKKRALSPREAATGVCEMVRADLGAISDGNLAHKARIFGRSSEAMVEMEDASVSVVVTSPPYLNNFDYAEMTRMQLYFWGMASSWGEITERVRSRLIVNTTTALKGHKERQEGYREEISPRVRDDLDTIVRALAGRRTQKAGKKEYDLLVYPYFAQMTRVFRECLRVMRPGARLHAMIADSALYGIHIRAPQILSRILGELGFADVGYTLVRKRGHRWVLEKREGADEGLGEYHVRATR